MRLDRVLIVVLIVIAAVYPTRRAVAQVEAPLDGRWVVGRAGDDDLSLLIEVEGDTGHLTRIGHTGSWDVLPDGLGLAERMAISVGAPTEGLTLYRLEREGWRAQLHMLTETTAVFIASQQSEIGLAWRLAPVPASLLGDWERAELLPVGPRLRRLTVLADELVFFDRSGEPTAVPAAGVSGWDLALVLLPEDRSGALVRLVPFESGFVALEVGDEQFEIVYRPGEAPPWLWEDLEPAASEVFCASGVDSLSGRWLVGEGDSGRQVAVFDLGVEPATYRRLGPDETVPAAFEPDPAHPHYRVRLGIGEEAHHVLFLDDNRGVMWRADENEYRLLRRALELPEAWLGEWRIEGERSWLAEPVWLEADALERPGWEERIPVVAAAPDAGELALALLREDRTGRLLRLRSLGETAWVTEEGALWYRPGERETLAEHLATDGCGAFGEGVVAHLLACARASCGEGWTAPSCQLADDFVEPLRCTADHRQEGERRLRQACDAFWPGALSSW